ncbi:hypothetical protein [Yoonia algicola]|uniref:Uncharacterized protein n=1 Tax=Yoonia algicola TaxID=3137368 RepID=A0AAN0M3G8_9RHOB
MAQDQEPLAELPLEDAGLTKAEPTNAPKSAGKTRLLMIPLLMLTLFSGAVIGMYFQPPA